MHYRNVVCLLSFLVPSAWGCSLGEPDHNIYQKQGKGVVYLRPNEETNLSLPEVNYQRLRRLPDLFIAPDTQDDGEKEPPLNDLTTDYIDQGAWAWYPNYAYFSDGRFVIYAGKIVQNPSGYPPVDVASFHSWGDFAVDKNSIYYKGRQATRR